MSVTYTVLSEDTINYSLQSVSPLLNYVLKRFILAILGYFIQNYKENRQIPCHTF